MRLVSLTPSNTELVAFLGLAEHLVGVDDWSDWPPGVVKDVQKVGPDLQIDVDLVAALEPDLVLASLTVPGQEPIVEELEERGIAHVVLAPKTLGAVLDDARRLGAVLGTLPGALERGAALADAMADELDRVRGATVGRPAVTVYWEWWPKPPITIGGPGWMSELLRVAGGRNAFEHRTEESPQVTADEVAATEPDVVALCWQGSLHPVQSVERFVGRGPVWASLPAVAQDQVLLLPEALFGRPGPRLVEGVRLLTDHLHPGLEDELGGPGRPREPYGWLPDGLKSQLPLAGAFQ